MIKVHRLKTRPEFFQAVWLGIKPFEFRVNDRDYQTGDVLILEEFEPLENDYSGREITAQVTYNLQHPTFPAIPDGYIIMGIRVTDKKGEINSNV